jgi:hypothetical protein
MLAQKQVQTKQAQKNKLNRIFKIIEEAEMKILAFFVLGGGVRRVGAISPKGYPNNSPSCKLG